MQADLMPPPMLYEDNLQQNPVAEDLEEMVQQICSHGKYLSRDQRDRLAKVAHVSKVAAKHEPTAKVNYGADFDLSEEVGAQIMAVRAVRDKVMVDGRLAENVSTREAKEVISTGGTLLTTLLKFHKDVINMDRIRRLETAVIEVLKEEGEEVSERVLRKLSDGGE